MEIVESWEKAEEMEEAGRKLRRWGSWRKLSRGESCEVEIVGFSGFNGEGSWFSVACWVKFCGCRRQGEKIRGVKVW